MTDEAARPFFGNLPLHDLTAEFSEAGLRQRLLHEVAQTDWSEETRELLLGAEELALATHIEDSRGDHPYSTHFLRVAIRLLSPDHLNVQDPDMLVAALLHDTVEDHPEFFETIRPRRDGVSAYIHALSVIEELFGERVAWLVAAVTNPERPDHIVSTEDKNRFYQEHVREVLETDTDAGVIKLSDFIDNCAGLEYNESPDKALKLAVKYLPLIADFQRFVDRSDYFDNDLKQSLKAQLERAENRCLDLIQAAA